MNIEQLNKLRAQYLDRIALRKREKSTSHKREILLCGGSGCKSTGSVKLFDIFEELLKQKDIKDVLVKNIGCQGLCSLGPIVLVMPDNVLYCKVGIDDASKIIEQHIVGGKVVNELLYVNEDGAPATDYDKIDHFKKQLFITRENKKLIDPTSIEDYIAVGGFSALYKVLNMTPKEVVEIIKESGLKGRGGGGFPTGMKWEMCASESADTKYIICNADEGDPGAFMDRSILEDNPHSVLESMVIGGYAIGANKGYIYVRAEYALAVERLQNALKQGYALGLYGKDLFSSGYDFDIEIKQGAGAFVCGEETALIASVEGRSGTPRLKPPYPAESGLFGKPTVVNNVETFATVTSIILRGAKWYKSIGEVHSGTKVFAVSGKVKNTGLVEMPMGTTLDTIINDVSGGAENGKSIKAVQLGGPSGGCISAKDFDTPVNYDSLKQLGSMMGSGGMIVLDNDTCMVDLARFFIDFTCHESCGKCTPCRIGTKRILEILNRICEGKGEMSDLNKLRELCEFVSSASLCGLGQSAPNPVLSTLNNFQDEYIEHIKNHRCPAGVCKALTNYVISESKCIGCGLCARNCPVNAISGEVGKTHHIDKEICIKCGKCASLCPVGAISKK